MAVYTANADALVARLAGREPSRVARLFDRAVDGRDGIETTPVHVVATAAVVRGEPDDAESAETVGRTAGGGRENGEERHDTPGRTAVRALLNGPVTVPRIGAPTLLRACRWLDDHDPADATLLAAHETRGTAGILTGDETIRETGVRVFWA